MKKCLTIKMHEHVNDEILSYVSSGVMHHKDSADFEAPIARGKLMLMNAGESFWHDEKVTEDEVEMLQIFVRPNQADHPARIKFYDKPADNCNWYVMVVPDESEAPLHYSQNVYVLDSHLQAGVRLEIPIYDSLQLFLYVMEGEIIIQDLIIGKQEAVTDVDYPLPPLVANKDSTIVLFFVDRNASMSMEGTISGLKK